MLGRPSSALVKELTATETRGYISDEFLASIGNTLDLENLYTEQEIIYNLGMMLFGNEKLSKTQAELLAEEENEVLRTRERTHREQFQYSKVYTKENFQKSIFGCKIW